MLSTTVGIPDNLSVLSTTVGAPDNWRSHDALQKIVVQKLNEFSIALRSCLYYTKYECWKAISHPAINLPMKN